MSWGVYDIELFLIFFVSIDTNNVWDVLEILWGYMPP